jgi:enoyl-CoA hydratase/carnithine racemase
VVTGTPACFSAGVDTKAVAAYATDERRAMVLGIDRLLARLYAYPGPTVAAVAGHALGGGLVAFAISGLRAEVPVRWARSFFLGTLAYLTLLLAAILIWSR